MHIANIGSKSRAFINHKPFHPGNFKNVEAVWSAEEAQRKKEKHAKERLATRAEEAKIEQLKGQLRQFELGSTKNQSVHGLDWMYENPADSERRNAETDILLGKVEAKVKVANAGEQLQRPEGQHIGSNANRAGHHPDGKPLPEDHTTEVTEDTLRKLREDPLFVISLAAQKQREKLLSNPYTRQMLLNQEAAELEESLKNTEEGRIYLELNSEVKDLRNEISKITIEINKLKKQRQRKDESDRSQRRHTMSKEEREKRLQEMTENAQSVQASRSAKLSVASAEDKEEMEREKNKIMQKALSMKGSRYR